MNVSIFALSFSMSQWRDGVKKSLSGNSLSKAFDDAYFEISILAEEMREAFDNTPDQFKENSGNERGITADYLEAMLQPSVPARVAGDEHHIEWLEMIKGKDGRLFRPARRDNVVRCLEAGILYASKISDGDPDIARFVEGTKIDIHNLKSLHFPGMSGR